MHARKTPYSAVTDLGAAMFNRFGP